MNVQTAAGTISSSSSSRFSNRRLLGLLAPVGPVAMAIWALAVPYHVQDEAASWIPAVVQQNGRTQLSMWGLFVFALTAGAGAIITGLVAQRGSRRLATIGMVLTFGGFSALSFNGAAYDGAAAASYKVGNDVATTERVLAELDKFQAPSIGAALFIPLMFIGVLLLGLALWRGRTVPRWAAGALLLAFPAVVAGGFVSMTLNAVGWVLMAIGFGVAGRVFSR
jgi:hypothetical protein